MNNNDQFPSFISMGFFQILILAILLFALINNAYLMTLLSILLLILAYGTKIWSKLSLKKLYPTINIENKRLFPEENAIININVVNKKILPVWIDVNLFIHNHAETFKENIEIQSGLMSFSKISENHNLLLNKRGVYTIGPVILKSGDLLGFYSSVKHIKTNTEIIVYPKIFKINKFSPKSKEFFGELKTNTFIKDPVQLIGTREYQYVGPSKNIHWQSTARTLQIHEKIFDSSSHLKIIITVDVEGFEKHSAEDEFEEMLESAASMIVDFTNNNIPTGLIINGEMIDDTIPVKIPDEVNSESWVMLEKLARVNMKYIEHYEIITNSLNIQRETTYIYFCHSISDKIISFYNTKKSVYIITSKGNYDQEYLNTYTLSDFM